MDQYNRAYLIMAIAQLLNYNQKPSRIIIDYARRQFACEHGNMDFNKVDVSMLEARHLFHAIVWFFDFLSDNHQI